MSKKCKNASREKRLMKKRAQKAANQAKYQSWAAAGENSKSFRNRKKSKGSKKQKGLHTAFAHCGNIACLKCFSVTELQIVSKIRLRRA